MRPESAAAAKDGQRGGDEELEREGGGEKERERGGETKDGLPWPPPRWRTEKRE